MEFDFKQEMSTSTNKDLLAVINNRTKFLPDAFNAAVAELERRGHVFSDEELNTIAGKVNIREQDKDARDIPGLVYSDETAIFPEDVRSFYSKSAIRGFSIFISPIFGAILLAINLKQNKKHGAIVVTFGITYAAIALFILMAIPQNSGLTLLLNAGGGFILTNFFWTRFVDNGTPFKSRSISTPLVIAVFIIVLFIWLVFAAENM